MSLTELKAAYFTADQTVVDISADRAFVEKLKASKCSCTWASGPLDDTGWEQLGFNGSTVYVARSQGDCYA